MNQPTLTQAQVKALVVAFEDLSNTQGRAEQYTPEELHGDAFADAHAAVAAFRGQA